MVRLFIVVLLILPQISSAQFNAQINYQGKLLGSGNSAAANGNYNVRFKIYNVATGGSPLWTETWCYSTDSGATCSGSGTDSRVALTSGLFSVMLGSTTPFSGIDFNQTLYLGVDIGGTGATPTWDGEMLPRKKMGAVPAAFVAQTLDGLRKEQFLRSDATNATNTASTFLSVSQIGAGDVARFTGVGGVNVLTLKSAGNVGIATVTPDYLLSVGVANTQNLDQGISFGRTSGGANAMRYGIRSDASGNYRGSITITDALGTSVEAISFSGHSAGNVGFVGIGTTSPLARLSVAGNAYIGGNLTATGTVTLGTLTGPLQAINGLVSATSTMSIAYGGTGLSTAPTYGQVLLGQANGTYSLVSTSSLGISGSSFSYLFPSNATSTLLSFTGGLTSYASTTIGAGTQAGGLTISGGATTTGNAYFAGNVGIGTSSPESLLDVDGVGTFGTENAGTAQLVVKGGVAGGAMVTLKRTVGAPSQFSWLLAGGGLTFADDTNGFNVTNIFGDSSQNQLFIGQRGKITSDSRVSLLSGTTFSSSAGSDVAASELRIQGGLGTGAGTPGDVTFYTGATLGSGSTAQTGASRVVIKGNTGNLGVGTSSPFALLSVAGNAYIGGNLTATGTVTLGTLTGPLQAINGLVSATSTMSIAYGGTGLSTAPTYGQLLLGNASGGYSLTATSSLGLAPAFSATYPIQYSGNVLSLAFGTTTANSWSALQQFNTGASTTQITSTGNTYLATAGGAVGIGTTTPRSKLTIAENLSGPYGALSVWAASGNATDPLVTFWGDTSPETLRATFLRNGNFGLGTSTPISKLTITETGATDIITIEDQANDATPFRLTSAGRLYLNASSTEATTSWNGVTPDLTIMTADHGAGSTNGALIFGGGNNRKTSFIGNEIQSNFVNSGGTAGLNLMPNMSVGSGVAIGTTTNNWLAYLSIQGTTTLNSTANFASYNSAGTNILRLTDAGNLGIGSTTPFNKLSVSVTNAGNVNDGLTIERGSGTNAIGFKLKSDASGLFRGAITYKNATQAEEEVITIGQNSGANYVGIGTTTPRGSLHVASNGSNSVPSLVIGTAPGNPIGSGLYYDNVNARLVIGVTGNDYWGIGYDGITNLNGNGAYIATGVNGGPTETAPTLMPNQTDLNTGIGQLGADSLSLITGGTGVLRLSVASSSITVGNFGIGTTSPFARLSVAGNAYIGGNITATGTLAAGTTTINNLVVTNVSTSTFAHGVDIASGCFAIAGTCIGGGGSGSGTVNSGTQGQMAFYNTAGTAVSGTSTLIVAQNQTVGIGTTTPAGKFAVTYDIGSTDRREFFLLNGVGAVFRYDDNSTAGVTLKNLSTFASTSFGSSITTNLSANVGGVVTELNAGRIQTIRTQDWSDTSTTNTSAMTFWTRNGASGFAERMRISPEGFLGIGTTAPSARLHIAEPSAGTGTALGQLPNSLRFESKTVTANSGSEISFTGLGTQSGNGTYAAISAPLLGNNATGGSYGYLSFSTKSVAADTSLTERVRINPDGSVSVGTTSPYSKLTVWGSGTGTGQLFSLVNSASTTLVQVLDNGNFGIGSTSPFARLAVVGTVASSPAIVVRGASSQSANIQEWQISSGAVRARITENGEFSNAPTTGSEVFGRGAAVGTGVNQLVIGNGATTLGSSAPGSIAIGNGATISGDVGGGGSIVIGSGSTFAGSNATIIGNGVNGGNGNGVIVIGQGSALTGGAAMALGLTNTLSNFQARAVGNSNVSAQISTTLIGTDLLALRRNEVVFGDSTLQSGTGGWTGGQRLRIAAAVDDGTATSSALFDTTWLSSVTGSQRSRLTLSAYNAATAQEGLRIDGGASNPTVILAAGGGNVGIGTTNPTQKLSVSGSGAFTGALGVGTTSPLAQLNIYTAQDDGIRLDDTTNNRTNYITNTSYGLAVNAAGSGFQLVTGGQTRMTVDSPGNVGIGTTSPFARLSVAGSAYIGGNLTATGTLAAGTTTINNLVVTNVSTSTFAHGVDIASGCFAIAGICIGNGSSGSAFSYLFPGNATSTLLTFSGGIVSNASTTIGAGAQTTGLTISGGATTTGNAYFAGNVGIGTTTIGSKFTLAGGNFTQTASGNPTLSGTYNTSGVAYGVYSVGKYVYVADDTAGLQIVDVSVPTAPTLVGTYSTGGVSVYGVKVSGKYAFIAGNSLFSIIDISNPFTPTLVGTYNPGSISYNVAISGKYAYLAAASGGGLQIIDISNPTAPTLVGTYNSPGTAYGVFVSGKYAYLADASQGLQIVDVSNPVLPALVGSVDTSGTAYNVYVSGKYAYLADGASGLQVIDVGNPVSPSIVGVYDTAGTAYEVQIGGRYAYVADYSGGMAVLDISVPTAPFRIGSYSSGALYSAHVVGKYAYAGDNASGVRVLNINGIEAPTLLAGMIEGNQLSATENIVAGGNIYANGGMNVGISGIFSRGTISAFIASTTESNPVVANFMGGNVGIGTTTPYERLSVAGNVVAAGFIATSTGVQISTLTSCDSLDTDSNGNLICGTDAGAGASPWSESAGVITPSSANSRVVIGTLSGVTNTALSVFATSSGTTGLVVRGAVNQTANFATFQNSDGETVTSINNRGGLMIDVTSTDIVKDTTGRGTTNDFDYTGSTLTNLSSVAGQDFIDVNEGTIPASGQGQWVSTTTVTSAAIGAGAHVILRTDGKYLIIHGGGTATASIWDGITGGTMTAFPGAIVSTGSVGRGATSIRRPDGRYLIIHGGATTATTIFDPFGRTPPVAGPAMGGSCVDGTSAFLRDDGFYVILCGGTTAWGTYNPTTNAYAAGTAVATAFATGTQAIMRDNKTFLVLAGGGTTAYGYNPFVSAVGTMTAAPLGNSLKTNRGTVVIRRNDGKFIVVSSTTQSQIYLPNEDTIVGSGWGDSTAQTGSGFGPSADLTEASTAMWRQDGKYIILHGNGQTATTIYDPSKDNSLQFTAGPALGSALGTGATAFMLPDGTYAILRGGGTAVDIYDIGFIIGGSGVGTGLASYESECIASTGLNPYSSLAWTTSGEGSITVQTRVGDGACSGSYTTIQNNGDKIPYISKASHVQFRVYMKRTLPKFLDQDWGLRKNYLVRYRRNKSDPTLFNLVLKNDNMYKRSLYDFGAMVNATSSATSSQPTFVNLVSRVDGVGLGLSNISNAEYNTTPNATNLQHFNGAFASSTPLLVPVATSSVVLKRPDGKFLILSGATTTTNVAQLYDPVTQVITLNSSQPAAAPGPGALAFKRPDGKFFIVIGNNNTTTSVYDPVADTFTAGVALSANAGRGAFVVPLANGQVMIAHGGGSTATSIYDPIQNRMKSGPLSTASLGAGSLALPRPDGTYFVTSGASDACALQTATAIFDPMTMAFRANTNVTVTTGLGPGAFAFQRTDGKWVIVNGGGVATSCTATNRATIYDPVSNRLVTGPTLTTIPSLGSRHDGNFAIPMADGSWMLVQAGATTTSARTQIYSEKMGAISAELGGAPIGTFLAGYTVNTAGGPNATISGTGPGAIAFQQDDGKFFVIAGGLSPRLLSATAGASSTDATYLVDAGWTSTGMYKTEAMFVPDLDANSVLSWKASTYKGVSVEVKTATTSDGLQTASARQISTSGGLINPGVDAAGNAEKWVQFNFNFSRTFPSYKGIHTDVWYNGATPVHTQRDIGSPVLSEITITKDTDFLNLKMDGLSVFRVNSNGSVYLADGGTVNTSGADLAERYSSRQELKPGEVVAIDPINNHAVQRTTHQYQNDVMGIVSTDPGFVAGAYTKDSYPIALVGRVPVKVSTENGMIKAGDRLTPSSVPGHAMKASLAGRVVGKALESLDASKLEACPPSDIVIPGRKCGTVMVFMNLIDYSGETIDDAILNWEAVQKELLRQQDIQTVQVSILDGGIEAEFESDPLSDITIGISTSSMLSTTTRSARVLSFLEDLKKEREGAASSRSEMFVDRVSAVNEVIAPSFLAKALKAEIVDGAQIISTHIEAGNVETARLLVRGKNSDIVFGEDGQVFLMRKATSSIATTTQAVGTSTALLLTEAFALPPGTLISFTDDGGAFFAGELVARGLKTESLTVEGLTTLSGGLLVSSIGTKEGELKVMADTFFAGRAYFNSDSAGDALIPRGGKEVAIKFVKPFAEKPVVNANFSFNESTTTPEQEDEIFRQDIRFVITRRSPEGFRITLNKPAPLDVLFSWTAVGVKDKTTFNGVGAQGLTIFDPQKMHPTTTPPIILTTPPEQVLQVSTSTEATSTPASEPIPQTEISTTSPTTEIVNTPTPIDNGGVLFETSPSPTQTPEPAPTEVAPTEPAPTPVSEPIPAE